MAREEIEETEETEDTEMDNESKSDRIKRLKAEIAELEDEGLSDKEVEQIAKTVDKEVDAIADTAETPDEVEKSVDDAADSVENELEKKGVILSEEEKENMANRIAELTYERMSANETPSESTAKPSAPSNRRVRDKPPKSTHWTERKLWGGRG